MHHALVARPQFNGANIAGLFEFERHYEVAEDITAACGQRERTGNLHHQIGRSQLPFFWKIRRWRQVSGIAFRRSALQPLREQPYLAVSKPARSFEITV